jgi:peptidyl-dipeptidase A
MNIHQELVWRIAATTGLFLVTTLPTHAQSTNDPTTSKPTVAEAKAFLDGAEKQLFDLGIKAQRADWVQQNFITVDTQQNTADANQLFTAKNVELSKQAHRFDTLSLPPELARKMRLLKISTLLPSPKDPAKQMELAQIEASLSGDYGRGKWCPDGFESKCLDVTALGQLMAKSRDPEELKKAWAGWQAVGAPMRVRYTRMVELTNEGARELGFPDAGEIWKSQYDMPSQEYEKEVDRLWQRLQPFYASLHAYVRAQLVKKYGKETVPPNGPIPAHLLGNLWSQEWNNIADLMDAPESPQRYDLSKILQERKTDARGMVKYGENFFISLGFAPLPQTFWERSLFTKPADREVVCHASAWDIDNADDVRIKVCLHPTAEDFQTVHHELGHNFYQRAYKDQPPLFQNSANDGFHEAVGDTISLSITPDYLKQIGLIDSVPPPSGDTKYLLETALEKIAFLPFGYLIDKWRWDVFAGKIKPGNYNQAWWDLRTRYQGVAPSVARSESDFDPGSKSHIAGNVPYSRYFLARILQFQFYRALCRDAGFTGPLYRCSFYGNKAAGAKLSKMLAMGNSRPWPDELEALTGERQLDAGALLEYFAPLKSWLDEQNRENGNPVGW